MRLALNVALPLFVPTVLLTQEPPPHLLLIVQEQLKPKSERAYARIEREIANACARLKCPHPYLALESVTEPKEVWWFNAFASEADKEHVEHAYARNEVLTRELRKLSRRKATLTHKPLSILTTYRGDLSRDGSWQINGARFFVVTVTNEERKSEHSVFEAPDGTRFFVAPAVTRRDADLKAALAGSHTRIFAIRPLWSLPADSWTAADPKFWQSPSAHSRAPTLGQ